MEPNIINSKTRITMATAPYKIYNIGNNHPVTFADVDELISDTGFKPTTGIEEGIVKFVDWYKGYYLE